MRSLAPLLVGLTLGCSSPASTVAADASAAADGGAPADAPALGDSGGTVIDAAPPPEPTTPKPAIVPTLLAITYVGGAGNQYIRDVAIGDDGSVTASGKGFAITYPAGMAVGKITGDATTVDADPYSEKPTLYKDWNTTWSSKKTRRVDDARTGLSYFVGTKQVSPSLMQPIVLACALGADCDVRENQKLRLWDWWASVCSDKSLTADSRGYDVFLLPGKRFGVQAWTDGGNSTLSRWPVRDDAACKDAASCPQLDVTLESGLSKDTWQAGPNSLSTMYMVVDGPSLKPVAATFVRAHVSQRAVDAWGRIYLPQAIGKVFPTKDPDNLFGQSTSASTGLFVLSPDLKTAEVNTRLGGTCSGGQQVFGAVAQRGNLLVLGGTTCATDLRTTANAVQKTPGGGQDGMLVILKLWD